MRPRMLAVAGELGLTPPQMFALRALDPERPVPMRELAVQLHCDNSNVTGLVDGLEAHGLVERRAAEHDRRVRMLVVTERGAQVRARINEVVEEVPAALARSARRISGRCATSCGGRSADAGARRRSSSARRGLLGRPRRGKNCIVEGVSCRRAVGVRCQGPRSWAGRFMHVGDA